MIANMWLLQCVVRSSIIIVVSEFMFPSLNWRIVIDIGTVIVVRECQGEGAEVQLDLEVIWQYAVFNMKL